jgi:uncharacterized membrane protein YvbJ
MLIKIPLTPKYFEIKTPYKKTKHYLTNQNPTKKPKLTQPTFSGKTLGVLFKGLRITKLLIVNEFYSTRTNQTKHY